MNRDILIKNITILENFNKWLIEKSIYNDYDYCTLDDLLDEDSDEDESITDRLNRIVRHMKDELE